MSYTAIHKDTGESFFAPNIPNLKQWFHKNELKDKLIHPLTHQPVLPRSEHIRHSTKTEVVSHFYTAGEGIIRDDIEYDPDYMIQDKSGGYRYNESMNHIRGKLWLWSELKSAYKLLDVSIQMEYRIPITRTGKWRVIDVAVLWRYGGIEAYEIQNSSISVELFKQRCDDYTSEGINSEWYFYEKAVTNEIRKFTTNNQNYRVAVIELKSESHFT